MKRLFIYRNRDLFLPVGLIYRPIHKISYINLNTIVILLLLNLIKVSAAAL